MQRVVSIAIVLAALSLTPLSASASENACLGCHDFGPDSPVHPMLDSPHGKVMGNCERCHGPSEDHMSRPTIAAPDVSFGPRWTATTAEQDDTCLMCHRRNAGKHWQDALHMVNNITCVGCHDLHVDKDPVSQPGGQVQVCTMCHQTQREGMHAMAARIDDNPDCTTCHNPHADQRAESVMLTNDSAGCRTCHNLASMEQDSTVNPRANSYHRAMNNNDQLSCASCHVGIAHGPDDAADPFTPMPTAARDVILFYPGQSDSSWILSEHPGSQPFRQGSNCQRCHRNNEKDMGNALGEKDPTWRSVSTRFRLEDGMLEVRLSWQGDEDDSSIALMWGDGGNQGFKRGGCWAACHSDMPGMTRDRGQGIGKYLQASRSQQQRIGQPALVKDAAALNALFDQGNYVELWKIDLRQGRTRSARLLSELDWLQDAEIASSASFNNGVWEVVIRHPMQAGGSLKPIVPGRKYTMGLALHGKGRTGGDHWVSLPMSFSLDGDDTDFMAE